MSATAQPSFISLPGGGRPWRLARTTDLVLELHLIPGEMPQSVLPAVGLFAEHDLDRVARDQMDDKKNDERGEEEDRNQLNQSTKNIESHARLSIFE